MEKREKARQYWFVVQQLTTRELKRKYARSVLGVVWSVLNPLLSMAVLSLIFSQLFRRFGEPGLLPGGLWGDAGGVPGAP